MKVPIFQFKYYFDNLDLSRFVVWEAWVESYITNRVPRPQICVLLFQAIGEAIRLRKLDYEDKTKAFENLFCSIQIAQKKISMFKEGDERLNHLDAAEVAVAEEKVSNALKWAENAQSLMNEFTDKSKAAPVPTNEIKNEMQVSRK